MTGYTLAATALEEKKSSGGIGQALRDRQRAPPSSCPFGGWNPNNRVLRISQNLTVGKCGSGYIAMVRL
jgi:hypothetical protein